MKPTPTTDAAESANCAGAKPAYTPGPWQLDKRDGFNDSFISERYHFITAGCGYYTGEDDNGFELCGCISPANARLIASAPELLEALSVLSATSPWDIYGDEHTALAEYRKFVKRVSAVAIAKATGSAP
jgi:hypothetical protein